MAWQSALLSRDPADGFSDEAKAAATASSGVKAVSGLAMRSSTQLDQEKVVSEERAGNVVAATETTRPNATRGIMVSLTILRNC